MYAVTAVPDMLIWVLQERLKKDFPTKMWPLRAGPLKKNIYFLRLPYAKPPSSQHELMCLGGKGAGV